MNTQITKQELKNWIDSVDDQAVLKSVQLLKDSMENALVNWNTLPENVKKAILKARKDVEAGRIISNKDFWTKYEQRL